MKRKINRLVGYDYSQNGAYFLTICTKERKPILWKDEQSRTLSIIGSVIKDELQKLETIYGESVHIVNYAIMPNHLHILLLIQKMPGDQIRVPSVSRIVNLFKGSITKQLGYTIWQRSFYDTIVRTEKDFQTFWSYIEENPSRWHEDQLYC